MLLCCLPLFAQESIQSSTLEELKASFQPDASTKAKMNILLQHEFSAIGLDQEIIRTHNNDYRHEIPTGSITNQKSTGRCWIYAMINILRPLVIKKFDMDNFELSENYLAFYDKLEKANIFLEEAIARAGDDIRAENFQKILRTPLPDGGYWQMAVDLIKKYGCVPIQAMPEVASNQSSREMNNNINWLLRSYAYEIFIMKQEGKTIEELRKQKHEYLKTVYRMLCFHLGIPVENFIFRYTKKTDKQLTEYKEYTPKTFYNEFIEPEIHNFMMFANWPAREYNKYYQVESTKNVIEGTFLNFVNLPMDQIKQMMFESIIDNMPVNFSSDVDQESNRINGIMKPRLYLFEDFYGVPFPRDKKINSVVGNVNSTHAMAILGVDWIENNDKKTIIKWKVENSWGEDRGNKGIFAMYDDWADEYAVRVVLHKKYIPDHVWKLQEQTPIMIPDTEPEQ